MKKEDRLARALGEVDDELLERHLPLGKSAGKQ